VEDFLPSAIKFEDIKMCQKTWDSFKQAGRSQACIKMCNYVYEFVITPKPRKIEDNYFLSMKIILENLGSSEEVKD